jgi:hypothetical protein
LSPPRRTSSEMLSVDPWVEEQKKKRVKYERRKGEQRIKRLMQSQDFVDFAHDFIEQVCGVQQPAPRDRGAEALQRFEGGRDVGLALRQMCTTAEPGAMVLGLQRALKRIAEREEAFRKIEDKARSGKRDAGEENDS